MSELAGVEGVEGMALDGGRPRVPARLEATGLTPGELAALMPSASGAPSASRGKAFWAWLRGLDAFPGAWPGELGRFGVGREALEQLKAAVQWPELKVAERVDSLDGTVKWRLVARGLSIETVLIPTATRATVCVSSQSGCTRFCDFCATATMGYRGGLTAGEIVAQVLLAKAAARQPVTNVVFMGMGEPLDNYDAVLQATRVLEQGLLLGSRHVTVSTSGVLPQLKRLWADSRVAVALSLHATTQELRDELMPRVKRWPLTELTAFMREASAGEPDNGRHFFIEYVMLADVNDGLEDANRLADLLRGVRARVNLIPFNPTPGIRFQRPSTEKVRIFQECLIQRGLVCLTRETRGEDTAAACGQLAAAAR